MGDTYNFNDKTQFIKEAKDNVKITQNNYGSYSKEFEQKLDKMLAKLDESQANEINTLIDSVLSKIDENNLREKDFSEEEIEEFNEIKYSSDTKAKIKWTYPLSTIIKELTGFSAEFEKEWKMSKEIKPDSFLMFLRKVLRHQELQELNLNQIDSETDEIKLLPK